MITTAVCQDGVGGRQSGSHSTRPHNHSSQTPLLVPLLVLSSIICRPAVETNSYSCVACHQPCHAQEPNITALCKTFQTAASHVAMEMDLISPKAGGSHHQQEVKKTTAGDGTCACEVVHEHLSISTCQTEE
ncbi:uncharacterized protein GJ701_008512 isoform 1-T1 [Geothlypis trichas]